MTDQTAMAFACRALRFFGVAEMIERDQLSPAQVASLFAVAASDRATKDGAAAATARFNASLNREGFDGNHERGLALWPR